MVKFLASGATTHACCVGGDLKHLDAHFDLAERTGLEFGKKTGCKIICGAPTTLAVKGLMMMMMMIIVHIIQCNGNKDDMSRRKLSPLFSNFQLPRDVLLAAVNHGSSMFVVFLFLFLFSCE